MRLFAGRARLVLPVFEVAPENAAHIARVCQRLDGIPLAIEMAAARVNLLTSEQLANRLDNAFSVLSGGSRTALPRQQTLRATIDWSYNLLSEQERQVFLRMSVFAGGCTLEAAEAVGAGDGVPASQVLALLAALVAKSMVVAEPQPGAAMRYRLLEMSREYAREKLEAAGDGVATRNRHRDYFLAYIEANVNKPAALDLAAWQRQRGAERDNVRQALEWSFSETSAQGAVDAGPRLVSALCGFFPTWEEGLAWSKRGVNWCESHPEIALELYAKLLGSISNFMSGNDLPLALKTIQKAVEISRRLGPTGKVTLMWNLTTEGLRYRDAGDCDLAVAPYAEAEAIYGSLPPEQQDPDVAAYFVGVNADLALEQGRYQDAKTLASERVRLCEAVGDKLGSIRPHMTWGDACLELGEFDQAHVQYQHAFGLAGLLTGDAQDNGQSYARLCHATTDLRQGNLERGLEYCHSSIRQANKIPDYNIIASALGICAGIWAKQDQALRAATLAGASQAMYARQSRKPWEDTSLDTLLPGWREGQEQAAIQQAYEAGQAMSSNEAVAYALEA